MTAHLFAATFRSFGIEAQVLRTYEGSISARNTLRERMLSVPGDVGRYSLLCQGERERLGRPLTRKTILFHARIRRPCRFGLYNKYQRIVLDSFPGLKKLKISSVTTKDGYSVDGLLEKEKVLGFKKAGFLSVVVADILDRLTWRVRPYEKEHGATDTFMEQAMHRMAALLRLWSRKDLDPVLSELMGSSKRQEGSRIPRFQQNPHRGRREIFLRMHRIPTRI